MPDGLLAALALPGLVPLVLTALAAGTVYGFAGFGTALIFMPLATLFVAPETAVLSLALFGVGSAVSLLPRAWSEAVRPHVLTMLAGALVALPAGTWALARLDPTPLRWAISGLVAITLAALVTGWRYRAAPRPPALAAVGALAGLVGGATGLTGPAVILFNLAGPGDARRTRANTLVFLTLLGVALIPGLALQGLVTAAGLWTGVLLLPAYVAGGWVGQRLFRPERETLYRRIAYLAIFAALIVSLPVWV
jgi:uncharacterized membrane protein YfcA